MTQLPFKIGHIVAIPSYVGRIVGIKGQSIRVQVNHTEFVIVPYSELRRPNDRAFKNFVHSSIGWNNSKQ